MYSCILVRLQYVWPHWTFFFLTPEQRGGFRGGRGRGFGARGNRSRGRIYWETHIYARTHTHTHTQYIWLIELHHIKIFSAPRWTICHLLFFFFLTGLRVFFTFQLAHPDFCCFSEGGWGFGFLSSEHQTLGSDFLTFTPRVPLGQGDSSSKSKCFFSPMIFLKYYCVFLWNKRLPSCNWWIFLSDCCRKRWRSSCLEHVDECISFYLFI